MDAYTPKFGELDRDTNRVICPFLAEIIGLVFVDTIKLLVIYASVRSLLQSVINHWVVLPKSEVLN